MRGATRSGRETIEEVASSKMPCAYMSAISKDADARTLGQDDTLRISMVARCPKLDRLT